MRIPSKFKSTCLIFLAGAAIFVGVSSDVLSQGVVAVESASAEVEPSKQPATFVEQLQEQYRNAKDAGTTTATSAAKWFSEQYEGATKNASDVTSSATTWVTELYSDAVKAGDTSARNAAEWVSDDISKIGTWEYKVVATVNSSVEAELNKLGGERWECFAVSVVGRTTLYLKRPHRSYLKQLPAKDLLRLAPLLQFGGDGEVSAE